MPDAVTRRHQPCPCGSGLDCYAIHHPRNGRFAFNCCARCGEAERVRRFPPVYFRYDRDGRTREGVRAYVAGQGYASERLRDFLRRTPDKIS